MSSKIFVQRVCQWCSRQFTARTTVTKYCSDTCAKRAYKAGLRNKKIEISNEETRRKTQPKHDLIKIKEFLTVTETAALLSSSRQTIYNLINAGKIKAVNIKFKKTLISRREVDKLFLMPDAPVIPRIEDEIKVEACYFIGEIQEKYGISEKALYDLINRHGLPKLKLGKYTYVPKSKIDQLLNPTNSKF
jgi:excisionase family DNA binding protein